METETEKGKGNGRSYCMMNIVLRGKEGWKEDFAEVK